MSDGIGGSVDVPAQPLYSFACSTELKRKALPSAATMASISSASPSRSSTPRKRRPARASKRPTAISAIKRPAGSQRDPSTFRRNNRGLRKSPRAGKVNVRYRFEHGNIAVPFCVSSCVPTNACHKFVVRWVSSTSRLTRRLQRELKVKTNRRVFVAGALLGALAGDSLCGRRPIARPNFRRL